MDINLLNWSELARRADLNIQYTHMLLTGVKRNRRRLVQLARASGNTIDDLIEQIARNKKGRTDTVSAHTRLSDSAPPKARTRRKRARILSARNVHKAKS